LEVLMSYNPVPDIIHRPSEALREFASRGDLPDKVLERLETLSLDPSIANVRMSLKEVFVIDNRDPGKGDIYLVTLVTDSIGPEPMALTLKTFDDIHDNEALQLGPGGLAIYRNPMGQIPRYLDYRIMVIESDQELRDAGEVIQQIREDSTFKSFRDNLLAITGAGQPLIALATAAADFSMGLIARILKMNQDDQLIYIAGSFDDVFDDLGVKHGLVPHKNEFAKVSYQVEAG
jgi:hypothetical protein